jgi:hypothetical protein
MKKGMLLNKWHWNTCKSIYKNMKFNIYFMPYIKTNSKWIIDFSIKIKAVKDLENKNI